MSAQVTAAWLELGGGREASEQALSVLCGAGLAEAALSLQCQSSARRLASHLPAFWARFERLPAGTADWESPSTAQRPELSWVAPALEEGLGWLAGVVTGELQQRAALAARLARLGGGDLRPGEEAFERTLRATLFASRPLGDLLSLALAQLLLLFAADCGMPFANEEEDEEEEEEEEEQGGGAEQEAFDMEGVEGPSLPPAGTTAGRLTRLASLLALLGLAGLAEECVSSATQAALRLHLLHRTGGGFRRAMLQPAQRWVAAVPLRFAAVLLRGLGREEALVPLRQWLGYALHAGLGALRGAQLFDIIVDFPDSSPALHDLRACLARTQLAPQLGRAFRASLRRRLLHAGAATADILTQYVGCIRALRLLDPSGYLLEAVSPPIRAYLFPGRRDAIRCIVQLLTDDGGEAGEDGGAGDSLMEELNRESEGGAHGEAEGDLEGDALPAEADDWERWQPQQVHAEAASVSTPVSQLSSQGDVVTLLVTIFGSRELFVGEYRALLAERLLGRAGYGAEREVRTLELLKLRFGEAPLHGAEVMLRDLAESKRVDGNVRCAEVEGLSATIISHHFWPTLGAEAALEVAMPPPIEAALRAYSQRYEALKAPRKLLWKKGLGSVRLELELGGEAQSFTVSPLHAALIWRFRERDAWRLEELAAVLALPLAIVQAKASFWTKAGVLHETRDADGAPMLVTADAFGSGAGGKEEGGEVAGALATAEETAASELASIGQYVLGMLVNYDVLSVSRIHNMLRMFLSEPPYDKTETQTEAMLAQMAAQDKIRVVDVGERTYGRIAG